MTYQAQNAGLILDSGVAQIIWILILYFFLCKNSLLPKWMLHKNDICQAKNAGLIVDSGVVQIIWIFSSVFFPIQELIWILSMYQTSAVKIPNSINAICSDSNAFAQHFAKHSDWEPINYKSNIFKFLNLDLPGAAEKQSSRASFPFCLNYSCTFMNQ